jgi:glycerol kinase
MVADGKMINTAAEIETLAASVPDNGGVYFVLLNWIRRAHWDQYARGAGYYKRNDKRTLARATLEGTYQVYDLAKSMEADFGEKEKN